MGLITMLARCIAHSRPRHLLHARPAVRSRMPMPPSCASRSFADTPLEKEKGDAKPAHVEDAEPTKKQLHAHAIQSAVPMVGFGIVDCIVMTQVGSTIDSVLGATLGISSLTAATIGLFCSDS